MSDFTLSNHSSIYILTPRTDAAEEWVSEHIPEDAMGWAGGIVIEHRYVDDIAVGIANDGLSIVED